MLSGSDNARAALLMTGSMAAFTLNDTCMKALSDELPLFQALLLRGAVVSLLLFAAVLAMRQFPARLNRRDWGYVGLRTMGEIGAAFFFVNALFHAPLANMTAILQALPLTVTLAAAIVFRERIGWRRLSAILVGFVGVLMIVRPGLEGFNVYSLHALAAVVSVTVRDLATRRLSREAPSLLVAAVAAAAVTAFAAAGSAATEWEPVSWTSGAQLAGSCAFILLAYLMSVMVMRQGDIGFVAPFRYTGLLWALLMGLLVFDDWPDRLTLLGGAIVVATGIFTLWGERRTTATLGPSASSRPGVVPARRTF